MTYARLDDGAEQAVIAALNGRADGIAVRTSGTMASAREVLLPTQALIASAAATHARLHGPGTWLLTVPTERVAGAMVLARSVLAGTSPVRMPAGSFNPEAFATTAATMPDSHPRYVSLVPTQLHRLAAHPTGRAVLDSFDAVLVGGAPVLHPDVPGNVVVTYGMTETSGGCVYDGVPLDGVEVALDHEDRVLVRGDVLMTGYSDGDSGAWVDHGGHQYVRSPDIGRMEDGRLVIVGRADDIINSGGHKVAPQRVAQAIVTHGFANDAFVTGVPDPEWGERVVAVVEAPELGRRMSSEDMRAALSPELERFELPRTVIYVEELPRLMGGKIDRIAVMARARQADQEPS